jgi:hypothetical protein
MRNLVVFTSLTLDGGMQAPGRSDEDPRSGDAHSAGRNPTTTPIMGKVAGFKTAAGKDLLVLGLGRRRFADGGNKHPKWSWP